MEETMNKMKRTHMCTDLTIDDLGKEVIVMGWVNKRRNLGGLIFVTLRDRTGILQVVFDSEKNEEIFKKAECIRNEFVLAVKGTVSARVGDMINPNMKTGHIEILVNEFRILSEAETTPILIDEISADANENIRLKYRYLDLRKQNIQKNLILRHKITKIARDYFDENGFLEIETPVLGKSTPEGARDYLVASRIHEGKFYALPQSPQIFKQLLMISGFDRYMQIVKCFRDEDLRADRQPEFTQIDLEMSFVDIDDVIAVNEGFIKTLFKKAIGVDVKTPISRITYKEAMDRFGTDKPDMRFGLELENISDVVSNSEFNVFSDTIKKGGSVRAINAKGCGEKFSRKEIDHLVEYVKDFGVKGLAWISVCEDEIKSPITKFLNENETKSILKRMNAETGDLICIIADEDKNVYNSLGELRLELARKIGLIKENEFSFVWITEFPLFEYNNEENRMVAMHHPFTSPMDEDVSHLDDDLVKVRSKAYDIVLNGVEIGGGSIRIHRKDVQSKLFQLIGLSKEEIEDRFGFLIEALKYGVPPHGGIAYGLDRLVMLMTGEKSIREVIAFPKVQSASCPMTGAPDTVDEKQLKEIHIKIDN